jgi:hypothetical protein
MLEPYKKTFPSRQGLIPGGVRHGARPGARLPERSDRLRRRGARRAVGLQTRVRAYPTEAFTRLAAA